MANAGPTKRINTSTANHQFTIIYEYLYWLVVSTILLRNQWQKLYWLVVLTILNNMKVNGKDDIPYILEKMFQTTNQL